jgi:hypothetical protein
MEPLGAQRAIPGMTTTDAEQYADAVAGDGTVVGGKVVSVEESYKAALCS